MVNKVYWMKGNKIIAMLFLLLLSTHPLSLRATVDLHPCSGQQRKECYFLTGLDFDGRIDFDDVESFANDFGQFSHVLPIAVLHPASVTDIATLIQAIYLSGSTLTVAAKGHAHSIHGQAQAENGVVIEMSSLRGIDIQNGSVGSPPFADVRGGELWIDVLRKSLEEGLAPRSWTDYLYLSVGGTLSNAGISGQAFRHGPQISNVYQLEVVTGRGDITICSKDQNSDLFYAVLGGLGQFGILTKARIALEPAPQRVKWIRVLYSDFDLFTHDQEFLISQSSSGAFDYIEGFVVTNTEGILNNWRSSLFRPHISNNEIILQQTGQIMYYLEVTKNYDVAEADVIDQTIASLLESLQCIPSSVFSTDISYIDFLDRVHAGELKLRSKGLWNIPHPWLNLLVPKSMIREFDSLVFRQILAGSGGPVLIYPMNRNKWDTRMSAVVPDEDIFYLVALLRSSSTNSNDLTVEDLMEQNNQILRFTNRSGTIRNGVKQYLPRFTQQSDWVKHYGTKWNTIVERKITYDPLGMLAPGQKIFTRRQMQSLHGGVSAAAIIQDSLSPERHA